MLIVLAAFTLCKLSEAVFYDSYYGTTLTADDLKQYVAKNNTFWCVVDINPCDPDEGRRLDGSCNNLQNPTRGTTHTPFYRLLPAAYGEDYEPRKTKSGNELPLARRLRTTLLAVGRVPSQRLTILTTHFLVFTISDVTSIQDTININIWKPYCCLPQGKNDTMCVPNKIPDDDPVHRFNDIRCQNMTRPMSFQTQGCIKNDTIPERISTGTPVLDLSNIYGSILNNSLKIRTYNGGLLRYEIEDGKIWPPSYKDKSICLLNQEPFESRCHSTADDNNNSILGINIFVIWLWRQHNRIANYLAQINPCWNDDTLFYTARDINTAIVMQIYFYELLPVLMGRTNLIRDDVISLTEGFRDMYDETVIPQQSLEYPYAFRWAHGIQEGTLKLFDYDGTYLKQVPIVNMTFRTGYLAVDNNLEYITQGSFRQPSAASDYVIDPFIAEIATGPFQRIFDVVTNDLAKGRYFGFPSYIKYREFCTGRPYRSYKDLAVDIDPERIELLKESYEDVEDIDLLAGMFVERIIEGGNVPPTFYCILMKQLIHNIVSDRHWYERPNRPNAFNYQQLSEIRKATVARLLCDVGDHVTHIQPHAFLREGPGNQIRSCSEIDEIDLNPWKDPRCTRRKSFCHSK